MTADTSPDYLEDATASQNYIVLHQAAQEALNGVTGQPISMTLEERGVVQPDTLNEFNKNVMIELQFERPSAVHHGIVVLANASDLTRLFSLEAEEGNENSLAAESLLSLGDIASTFLDTVVGELAWLQPKPRAWLANLEPIVSDPSEGGLTLPSSISQESTVYYARMTLTMGEADPSAFDIIFNEKAEIALLGLDSAPGDDAGSGVGAAADSDVDEDALWDAEAALHGESAQSSVATKEQAPVQPAAFKPLGPDQTVGRSNSIELIRDVPLRVSVELGRASLTVREILALGAGSVVELDRLAGEPADVLVNDRLIAHGEVVIVDESFGVRITEIIRDPNRRDA